MSDGMTLPDWLALYVGRLALEGEFLRQQAQQLLAERDDLLHRADQAEPDLT